MGKFYPLTWYKPQIRVPSNKRQKLIPFLMHSFHQQHFPTVQTTLMMSYYDWPSSQYELHYNSLHRNHFMSVTSNQLNTSTYSTLSWQLHSFTHIYMHIILSDSHVSYLLFPGWHHLLKLVKVTTVESKQQVNQPLVICFFQCHKNRMSKLSNGKLNVYKANVNKH